MDNRATNRTYESPSDRIPRFVDLQPRAFVTSRADVAAFIADELENNRYVREAVFVTSRPKQEKDR